MKTFQRGKREENAGANAAVVEQTSLSGSSGIKLRGRTGRPKSLSSATGREKSPLQKTAAGFPSQVKRLTWPVIAEPESEELKAHCMLT